MLAISAGGRLGVIYASIERSSLYYIYSTRVVCSIVSFVAWYYLQHSIYRAMAFSIALCISSLPPKSSPSFMQKQRTQQPTDPDGAVGDPRLQQVPQESGEIGSTTYG